MNVTCSRLLRYAIALAAALSAAAACDDGGGGGGGGISHRSPEGGTSEQGADGGGGTHGTTSGEGGPAGKGQGNTRGTLVDGGGDGSIIDPAVDLSCLKLRQLRGYAVSPSAIAQLFTVETCSDGTPVPGMT